VRIVLNTRSDDAAGDVCIHGLGARLRERGVEAVVNDWSGYGRYDVAVFLGYDHELERARAENSAIRVVLADPKQSRPEWSEAARAADGLLVSSIEQRDAFLSLNRNQLVFFMFPVMPAVERRHSASERVVIGYHGNRVHLETMVAGARAAIEELGRRRPVEFVAMYDIARLGRARIGVPDGDVVVVRHVQWARERFYDELARADIGIVPSQLPVRAIERSALDEPEFRYEPFDHVIRVKASSNPGRLWPFARLGIPVVADFAPSLAQFVLDGESGFLASSTQGWFEALERLADEVELREQMAGSLRRRLETEYEAQIPALLAFLDAPVKGPPLSFGTGTTSEHRAASRHHSSGAVQKAFGRLARLVHAK
jgi:glycosyltransferase involved in cell wall biosynthesis